MDRVDSAVENVGIIIIRDVQTDQQADRLSTDAQTDG